MILVKQINIQRKEENENETEQRRMAKAEICT